MPRKSELREPQVQNYYPRYQFIKVAGFQGLTSSTLDEIVRDYVKKQADMKELEEISRVLLNRKRPLPPIPRRARLRPGTLLHALYAARAIAYPPPPSRPVQKEDQVRSLLGYINYRKERFRLRPTKKVDPLNPIYSNMENICAYLVTLFLESTYASSSSKRSEFYNLIRIADQDTFAPTLTRGEIINKLHTKATTADPQGRVYLNSEFSHPYGILASDFDHPIAGITSTQAKTFGVTVIKLIRDMLNSKINQLSIFCRLSLPHLSHIIGISIQLQTTTEFIKILIYDPNDPNAHQKLWIHRRQVQSPQWSLKSSNELQKYIVIVLNRLIADPNTTPITFFCFKPAGETGMLPYHIPSLRDFRTPDEFNTFITKSFIAIITEVAGKGVENDNIFKYFACVLRSSPSIALKPDVLESGVDILDAAAYYGFLDITKKVVQQAQALSISMDYGRALRSAVEGKNLEVVNFLIGIRGIDLNSQDPSTGATPLNMAVIKNNLPIAQSLLAAGANRNIPDNKGKSPLDNARDINDQTLIQLLQSSQNP